MNPNRGHLRHIQPLTKPAPAQLGPAFQFLQTLLQIIGAIDTVTRFLEIIFPNKGDGDMNGMDEM